jgi:predicted ATPase
VRQFALEALAASGEEPRARGRHLDYFLALAERAEPELFRSEQRRWLSRLDAEHENVLAALEECERAPDGAEAALRIVSSLHRFWSLRGHFRIGEAAIDRALARVSDSTPEHLHAEALLARGLLVLVLGKHGTPV